MKSSPFPHGTVLHFVRHGATAANLVGLRCGGDIDLPLTDTGRRQALSAGRALVSNTCPSPTSSPATCSAPARPPR